MSTPASRRRTGPLGRAGRARVVRLAALLTVTCPVGAGAQGSTGRVERPEPAGEPHPYRPGIDVLDYDLTLDLPDSGRTIRGLAVLTLRRTAPVDALVLDLLALHVDSVWVAGRPVRFRRDAATIRVPLPAAAVGAGPRAGGPPQQQHAPNASPAPHQSSAPRGAAPPGAARPAGPPDERAESLTVAVRYGGEVRDGLIVSADARGRWMAFGDNWPNRARNWIPSVDHPSDKATVSWRVRAPSALRVVANGALLEETPLVGGASSRTSSRTLTRTLTRWRESRPIPVYLMVIAAAPLAYYDLGPAACGRTELPGCVRQAVYVAPEVRDFLPGPFAAATDIVDFLSALVAPFPYEKLSHVQSATRFGGVENASAIFYADRPFRDRTMGPGVIAHETAHQWFGDAVTEREWGHLWLSEGFASYFEQLWVQHAAGDSAFRQGMAQLRTEVVESTVTPERPVIDTAETDYMKLLNTNSYQKGAWVLHMLRATLGDSAFLRGVRSYYVAHRHGTAVTDDLRRAMEAASGQELGWFFDQWLRRPGVAEVAISWRYLPRAGQIALQLRQAGRFGAYRFPLVVDVVDSTGTVRRATVQVPAERQSRLTLPAAPGGAPARLLFDPDVELLARISAAGERP